MLLKNVFMLLAHEERRSAKYSLVFSLKSSMSSVISICSSLFGSILQNNSLHFSFNCSISLILSSSSSISLDLFFAILSIICK